MITLPAPAKINLFLHIVGRRPDGYHLLQTVFQFLDLHDLLSFELRTDGKIHLEGDTMGLAPEQNLIYKAAACLMAHSKAVPGVTITIEKRIPDGAGLGGGSSDAATTLIALNTLWDLNLPYETLHELALGLGADVPVFIFGQSAFGEGIGEILRPYAPPESPYLLVIPQEKISTPLLFSDPRLTRDTPTLTMESLSSVSTRNDFESLVRERYSRIEAAFQWLRPYGQPRLTGTGAALFLEFGSLAEANKIAKKLPKDLNRRVCRGHNVSPLVEATRSLSNFPNWGVAKW